MDCEAAHGAHHDAHRTPGSYLRFLSNPRWIKYTPAVSTVFIDGGAVGQIVQMIREQTAAGQNLWSWVSVTFMLCLWLNFYRVFTPDQKLAIWATALSIGLNSTIVATIVYFRFLLG